MKSLEDTSWDDVFEKWRGREAADPGWIQCATEVKGWPDWESWRRFSAELLGAEQLEWRRYLVENPEIELPALLVGPFQGWQNRLNVKNAASFADMMADPVQAAFFSQHEKVRSMMANFPAPTELIAVQRDDSGKIVCIEGHHRSAAVALGTVLGQAVQFTGPVTLALARLPTERVQVLEEMLRRGSSRET